MNSSVFLILFFTGAALVVGFVLRAVRRRRFDTDAFPSDSRKTVALGLLVAVLLLCVVAPFASGLSGRPAEPRDLSPLSAFALHAMFFLFLVIWYFLSGRPPLADFLQIRTRRPVRLLAAGFPIAAFAWGVSLCGMVAIQWIASLVAPAAARPQISPLIPWIAALPLGFKVAIVVSAMIFEEAFFRSFLQPRIGAVGATIFFTIAHGVYGNPAMLVGIFILSSVLAVTFELYRNALPGVVAHGAFDAFELFVLIPFALRFLG